MTRRWIDVKLTQTDQQANNYRITFSNDKQQFELDVRPMLSGKDYDKAMSDFNKKLATYNSLLFQQENEMERLRQQAEVYRSFSVSGYGIFN